MRIHSGLAEGQVLQRNSRGMASARIGGVLPEALSGDVLLTIRMDRADAEPPPEAAVGRASGGRWEANVRDLPVGGPYDLTFRCDTASVTVRRVLVGDVWMLAGQSNMQGCGNMDDAPPPHPLVHACYLWDEWDTARSPVNLFPSGAMSNAADRASFQNALEEARGIHWGVGPGIFFGREMVERTGGVPQGLIPCAFGGSSMDQWNPAPDADASSLFRKMVERVRHTGQPLAGLLWCQGEADGNRAPDAYAEKMHRLIPAAREALEQPDLPWLIVQVGRLHRLDTNPSFPGRLAVQEAQRLLPDHFDRLSVVPSMDLEMDDWIHIGARGYAVLGRRLARIARLYQTDGESGPDAIRLAHVRMAPPLHRHRPPVIEVAFDNVVGQLRSDGLPEGFRLIDDEGRICPRIHKVVLDGNQALLEACLDDTPASLGLRLGYGYAADQYCNIHDDDGMGLPVFAPHPIAD